jgi:hypothetical protein
MMEHLAKLMAINNASEHSPLHLPFLGLPILQHHEKHFSGNIQQQLHHSLVSEGLSQYYHTTLFSQWVDLQVIDFCTMEKAQGSSPLHINIFFSKWLSDTLPTGNVMQQHKQCIFNRCPHCSAWGKDRQHILICWDMRASVICNKQIAEFHDLL